MKITLPMTFFAYVVVLVIWPAWRVRKATGINPIRTTNEQSAHAYVTGLIPWLFSMPLAAILLYAFGGDLYLFILPFTFLGSEVFKWVGSSLLALSFIWTSIAQFQMGKSWRIGIDDQNRTELVNNGLFTISRNPIYLGFIAALVGLFLVLPNALTFTAAVTAWFVISIQIRLEEDFLLARHCEAFDRYMRSVRRWF